MGNSLPDEQDWEEIDGQHDSDDGYEHEDDDVLGDLTSFLHPHTFSTPLSRSASTDASSQKHRPGLSAGGISASTGTFVSAKTNQSDREKLDVASYSTSYFSASPLSQALSREISVRPRSKPRESVRGPMSLGSSSDYMKILEQNGLLPSIETELNWSGRKPGSGQHVEFQPYETVPVQSEGLIFCSATARIDKIRCRRILLARKSMVCHRKMTLTDAMNEVKHLNNLRHAHIVQLVGSYIQAKTFAVLLYPVADMDLKDFLQQIESVLVPRCTLDYANFMAIASLGRFFKCLAAALSYVHGQTTKHLDIKPRNVLIKRSRDVMFGYQVYLADFGISRSFASTDHSQTDAWVGRTARYCAPEVHWNETHGRAADVFSLGCVFLEMQTVLCRRPLDDLYELLDIEHPASTFHANLRHVFGWIKTLASHRAVFVTVSEEDLQQEVFARYPFEGLTEDGRRGSISRRHASLCTLIHAMLQETPSSRPRVTDVLRLIDKNDCCNQGREPFRSEAAAIMEPIDSAAELNRLFRKTHQTSAAEREDILYHIIESGDQPLTESFLRYFSAHRLEPSERVKLKGLQAAFLNNDFTLLKMLVETLDCRNTLHTVLVQNLPFMDEKTLENLVQSFEAENTMESGIEKLLPYAVKIHRTQLVTCMIRHGFHTRSKDGYGHAALDVAILIGSQELVHLLLEHNIRLRQAINDRAMLSQAVLKEHYNLATYLLVTGADPMISIHRTIQPGRTVLHDIASMAAPGNDRLLHLARLTIMTCDHRTEIASVAQIGAGKKKPASHGTPFQMLPFLYNRPWFDLLTYPPNTIENVWDVETLRMGATAVEVIYLNAFADRWEKYMSILTWNLTISNIVCLDTGTSPHTAARQTDYAHLFIVRDTIQNVLVNSNKEFNIYLEENPWKFEQNYPSLLGLHEEDPRIIYKPPLTQFAHIDRHSIVISLSPAFAARQAFADLLPGSRGYPVAIICERVDMQARVYPVLESSNDPISRQVQAFFRRYTAHDLTSPDISPEDEAMHALSKLTLYLRSDIHATGFEEMAIDRYIG
ncbi:unnamed protein product [Periconia digitata]|uniref:Protein kinase domain-containing protein n=1 Tax=Periconia digitata TaxID=1303443 RepID=A0A9W4XTN9_9PLEO|nr:unnamed protein product [Periconia digitata]